MVVIFIDKKNTLENLAIWARAGFLVQLTHLIDFNKNYIFIYDIKIAYFTLYGGNSQTQKKNIIKTIHLPTIFAEWKQDSNKIFAITNANF